MLKPLKSGPAISLSEAPVQGGTGGRSDLDRRIAELLADIKAATSSFELADCVERLANLEIEVLIRDCDSALNSLMADLAAESPRLADPR